MGSDSGTVQAGGDSPEHRHGTADERLYRGGRAVSGQRGCCVQERGHGALDAMQPVFRGNANAQALCLERFQGDKLLAGSCPVK